MRKKSAILTFIIGVSVLGAVYWYVLHLRRDEPKDVVRVNALLAQALREHTAGNTEVFLQYLRSAVTHPHWYPPDGGLLRAICQALQKVDTAKHPEANCLALAVIIRSVQAHPVSEPAIYYHTIRACFSLLEDKVESCNSRAYSLLKGHFDTASRQFKVIGRGGGVVGDIVYARRVESLARRKLKELQRICDSLTDIQKAM